MSSKNEDMAFVWGALVGALTAVHHVYGAIVYRTPWRLHAVALAAATLLAMRVALALSRRSHRGAVKQVAWWLFWTSNAVVFVLLIGGFEGAYNHVLKNVLWIAGVPLHRWRELFPAPTYELPNDAFFELSGAIQVIPAVLAAGALGALLGERCGRRAGGLVRPGDILPPRTLVTIAGAPIQVPDPARRIHLQLRRFAGCPVCSLHLRSIVRRRAAIDAAGIQEVVVFHSSTEALRRYAGDLPFAVVADPDRRLYRELGAEPSPRALLDPRAWPGIAAAVAAAAWAYLVEHEALPPLFPEGGRFGLPADVLIDRDGRVLAVKYGAHADDQWSVDELLELAGGGWESVARQPRSSSATSELTSCSR